MEAFFVLVFSLVKEACAVRTALVKAGQAAARYDESNPEYAIAKQLHKVHGVTLDTPIVQFVFDMHGLHRRSFVDCWNTYKLELHSHPVVFKTAFDMHGNYPLNVDGDVASHYFDKVTLRNLTSNRVWRALPHQGDVTAPVVLQRLAEQLELCASLHGDIAFDANTQTDPTVKLDASVGYVVRDHQMRNTEHVASLMLEHAQQQFSDQVSRVARHKAMAEKDDAERLLPALAALRVHHHDVHRHIHSAELWKKELMASVLGDKKAAMDDLARRVRPPIVLAWRAMKHSSLADQAIFIGERLVHANAQLEAAGAAPAAPRMPAYTWISHHVMPAINKVVECLSRRIPDGPLHGEMVQVMRAEGQRFNSFLESEKDRYNSAVKQYVDVAALRYACIMWRRMQVHLVGVAQASSIANAQVAASQAYSAIRDILKDTVTATADLQPMVAEYTNWLCSERDVTKLPLFPDDPSDPATAGTLLDDFIYMIEGAQTKNHLPYIHMSPQLDNSLDACFADWIVDGTVWKTFAPVLPLPTEQTAQVHAMWTALRTTTMPITFKFAIEVVGKLMQLY